jgi:putative tryptophan/tyrosine transport system substrate-binding protein
MIKRRQFIAGLGSTAGWPMVARAQRPTMPMVGYLYVGTPEAHASRVGAFRKWLAEAGYVEDRNVGIEYRWAYDETSRLPSLLADLINRRVGVVVAADLPSALAAKAATTIVPIVFSLLDRNNSTGNTYNGSNNPRSSIPVI